MEMLIVGEQVNGAAQGTQAPDPLCNCLLAPDKHTDKSPLYFLAVQNKV